MPSKRGRERSPSTTRRGDKKTAARGGGTGQPARDIDSGKKPGHGKQNKAPKDTAREDRASPVTRGAARPEELEGTKKRTVKAVPSTGYDPAENLRSKRFRGIADLEKVFDDKALISSGRAGSSVKTIQEALEFFGFKLKKYGPDGIFGSETEQAVIDFQKKAGASMIDGIVGPETMRLLDQWALDREDQHEPEGREDQHKPEGGVAPGFQSRVDSAIEANAPRVHSTFLAAANNPPKNNQDTGRLMEAANAIKTAAALKRLREIVQRWIEDNGLKPTHIDPTKINGDIRAVLFDPNVSTTEILKVVKDLRGNFIEATLLFETDPVTGKPRGTLAQYKLRVHRVARLLYETADNLRDEPSFAKYADIAWQIESEANGKFVKVLHPSFISPTDNIDDYATVQSLGQ